MEYYPPVLPNISRVFGEAIWSPAVQRLQSHSILLKSEAMHSEQKQASY